MPKPIHEKLAAARDVQNWDVLWREAIPIVKAIVDRVRRSGDVYGVDWDDMLQEGNLEAGSAIRKWNPIESTFGTWLTSCVKPRIHGLAYRQGARDALTDHGIDVEQLPGESVVEEIDPGQTAALLSRLDSDELEVVCCVYGFGRPAMSITAIAADVGWHHSTVQRVLDGALAKMREA